MSWASPTSSVSRAGRGGPARLGAPSPARRHSATRAQCCTAETSGASAGPRRGRDPAGTEARPAVHGQLGVLGGRRPRRSYGGSLVGLHVRDGGLRAASGQPISAPRPRRSTRECGQRAMQNNASSSVCVLTPQRSTDKNSTQRALGKADRVIRAPPRPLDPLRRDETGWSSRASSPSSRGSLAKEALDAERAAANGRPARSGRPRPSAVVESRSAKSRETYAGQRRPERAAGAPEYEREGPVAPRAGRLTGNKKISAPGARHAVERVPQ